MKEYFSKNPLNFGYLNALYIGYILARTCCRNLAIEAIFFDKNPLHVSKSYFSGHKNAKNSPPPLPPQNWGATLAPGMMDDVWT
jgi:hypothetical protein